MSLSPRAIATQGLGFNTRLVAVQGLWPFSSGDETLAGGRSGVSGYAAETTLDFDRISRRVKRAIESAVAAVSIPLTDAEQFVVTQSLRAFLASGAERTSDTVTLFVNNVIDGLRRSDLERRAAQQFAEDQFEEAAARLRRDNRRRAIILVILMML